MNPQLNPTAVKIMRALAYTENGGTSGVGNTKSGKTGEMKSIFQYTPDTWKNYSKQISGKELPMTQENESAVTYGKISKWIDQGHTPEQIASMWNAGESEPNAYTGKFSDGSSSNGTNSKYHIKFDVPGYTKKFKNYLNQFDKESATTSSSRPGLIPTAMSKQTAPISV